jgi:flagellar basal body-associated protein FliL
MERLVDRLRELLEELRALGYHPFQIKQIIEDTLGRTDLESLSGKEQEQLAKALEEYVKFALKCRSVRR